MAVRSYKRRPYPTVPMVGYNQDSVFAVNLGQVAEARQQLNVKWKSKRGPFDYSQARWPVWWGPSRESPDETGDYPGSNEVIDEARITLQHMLLQSDNHGERLLLFPAWPSDWGDLQFRLSAERNTTISGELKSGQLISLDVVPEERRKDVVVLPLYTPPPPPVSTLKTDDTAVSTMNLPPGPQFSAAQKQQQMVLGAALPAKIAAAHATGISAFRVTPGDYRWPAPTTAADTWSLVLDSLQRSADDPFTIDANGVTFWFETRGRGFEPAPHVTRGFRLVNCSHLILQGLTTDFDPPNTIEGRITAIDAAKNRMQLELSAGSLYRPAPPNVTTKPNVGRFIPYKRSGEFITPLYTLQDTRGLRFASWTKLDSSTQRFWATLENSLLLTTTAEPGWRDAFGSAGVLEEGDSIAIMYAVGSAIEILESESVTLSGWKNYAAKTECAETLGQGRHLFEHCVFGRRPGTNRLMGGEGVMSNAVRQGSRWRNVSISLTTDDLCELSVVFPPLRGI
jgi:hypothetical protein